MSDDNLDLDPKEVLMHLAEMGYCNITPKMLDDFISDLQKLILYEAKRKKKKAATTAVLAEQSENSSTMPSTTDESSQPSPSSPPPPPPPTLQRKHHYHTGYHTGSQWKDAEDASCSSSESSLAPAKRVLRECTKRMVMEDQENANAIKDKATDQSKASRPTKPCDCLWRRIGCKCYEDNREQAPKTRPTKENVAPPRPKSSFIRTWQLTGQSKPGSAPQRSDPVALYHHYQQLWKQQKLPGEARHNDLRWTIRERMLGQEPQPRSCSCCCCPCQSTDSEPAEKSSNALPRGPFAVDGLLTLPLKEGEDVRIVNKHITGVFKLSSGSESDGKSGPKNSHLRDENKKNTFPNENKKKRVECFLEEDLEKLNISCEKEKKRKSDIIVEDGDHQTNFVSKHNRETCKYCGLIHLMLNRKGRQAGPSELNKHNHKYNRIQVDGNMNSTSGPPNNSHCLHRRMVKDRIGPKTSNESPLNLQWPQEASNQNKFLGSETKSKKDYCLGRLETQPVNPPHSSKQPYWPQRFDVEAPICCKYTEAVCMEDKRKPCINSDMLSHTRNILNVGNTQHTTTQKTPGPMWKTQKHTLNTLGHMQNSPDPPWNTQNSTQSSLGPIRKSLDPTWNTQNPRQNTRGSTQSSQNPVDNYFKSRLPIQLKDLHGEVITEVNVKETKRTEELSPRLPKPLISFGTQLKLNQI